MPLRIRLCALLLSAPWAMAQTLAPLTVEKIMRDPAWMGAIPSDIQWSLDSKTVYFQWRPVGADGDSLFAARISGGDPQRVDSLAKEYLPTSWGDYDSKRTHWVYEKGGDLYLLHISSGKIVRLTQTVEREQSPRFLLNEKRLLFQKAGDLFIMPLDRACIEQVTNFQSGQKKTAPPESRRDAWLKSQERKLLGAVRQRVKEKKKDKKPEPGLPEPYFTGKARVRHLNLSPDERFVTFVLYEPPARQTFTEVPNYITESGYTESIPSRSKVGGPSGHERLGVWDRQADTVRFVPVHDLPGILNPPDFLPADTLLEKPREVSFHSVIWSPDSRYACLDIFSRDNKDRWIVRLLPDSARLACLDHQRDEAWIGGPGIRGWRLRPGMGWMPDHRRLWFQSEKTGYSHLYWVDVKNGEKKALTHGNFEIYNPQISPHQTVWYFSANRTHPGERHFYHMPLEGGDMVQITREPGGHMVSPSPDGKWLAVRFSTANRPWRLYLMPNRPKGKMRWITGPASREFLSYPWRMPEFITFTARDGKEVHARLFRPENTRGGPAVCFVHGAGYLQNAHKWWSHYFRENMFHNLLTDLGYTVLDVDYRGSAGYGRDWRTGIYRHMGGKDLSDFTDGARWLVRELGVDSTRIGIYGGSYGGFITLMALFTEPDLFAAGAALRSVTDWAHYSHWYTSNILNVPCQDSLAYQRSSPIYFAEGLKGALLMCHGMADVNVHFQDVVRLSQRLIELGKENWELAVYPVEGHGFQAPSSWTDEYKRILKLFELNLK